MQLVNNQSYNKNFTARNPEIRKADALCRLVNKEFPFFSNTKIDEFLPNDKAREKLNSNKRLYGYRNFISKGVAILRDYYGEESKYNKWVFKLFNGVKKSKFANCGEISQITNTVFELNGIKNTRTCALYAVNKETKEVRDLDHSIVMQGLKFPRKYKYYDLNILVDYEDLIKPDKKNIVIDSWAGFADYSDNAFLKYRNKPYFEKPLTEKEEIRILPYPQKELKNQDIQYIKQTYPELLLSHEDIKYDKNLAIKKHFSSFPEGKVINARILSNLDSSAKYLPTKPKEFSFYDRLMYWADKFSKIF